VPQGPRLQLLARRGTFRTTRHVSVVAPTQWGLGSQDVARDRMQYCRSGEAFYSFGWAVQAQAPSVCLLHHWCPALRGMGLDDNRRLLLDAPHRDGAHGANGDGAAAGRPGANQEAVRGGTLPWRRVPVAERTCWPVGSAWCCCVQPPGGAPMMIDGLACRAASRTSGRGQGRGRRRGTAVTRGRPSRASSSSSTTTATAPAASSRTTRRTTRAAQSYAAPRGHAMPRPALIGCRAIPTLFGHPPFIHAIGIWSAML
jgi:hypothetical protein